MRERLWRSAHVQKPRATPSFGRVRNAMALPDGVRAAVPHVTFLSAGTSADASPRLVAITSVGDTASGTCSASPPGAETGAEAEAAAAAALAAACWPRWTRMSVTWPFKMPWASAPLRLHEMSTSTSTRWWRSVWTTSRFAENCKSREKTCRCHSTSSSAFLASCTSGGSWPPTALKDMTMSGWGMMARLT